MELIATSKYYRMYQNATTRDFYLEVPGDYYQIKLCQLLSFRHQINKIDITEHFDTHHSNIEIISLCDNKQPIFLNTLQILDLKKLLKQIFIPTKEIKRYSIA